MKKVSFHLLFTPARTIKFLVKNYNNQENSFLPKYLTVYIAFPSLNSSRLSIIIEILYNNIAIVAIQHSKTYFVDSFGDFSHTVEWNALKSVWQIFLYILA